MQMPDMEPSYLLFGTIFALENRLQVLGDRLLKEITAKQWFGLVVLGLFGEKAPTLGELAEEVGSSYQNVKQIALKLEKKGYVTLESDKSDRRKCLVRPTRQWFELGEKYNAPSTRFMEQLFAGIPQEEIRRAVWVLQGLQHNSKTMGKD